MTDAFDHERDDGSSLAAEYALGVLDGASRRAVERRMAQDSLFAAEVDEWIARLEPLTEAVPAVEPPAGLWPAIENDLDRITRTRRAEPKAKPSGRRVSSIWQWLSIGSMGVAAASLAALVLVARPLLDQPSAGYLTATLASESGSPLFTVVIDQENSTATLIPVAASAAEGRVPELWFLPPDGAPESLGLLHTSQPLRLVLPGEASQQSGGALAVSLEPEGGSPTGLPTGPVVATGALQSV